MEIDGDVMTEFSTLSSQAHAIGRCVFELGRSKMCKDDSVKSMFQSDVSDQDSLNEDMLIMGSPSKNHYPEKTAKNVPSNLACNNLYRTNNQNITSDKNHLLPAWRMPCLKNVSPNCKISSNVTLEPKFCDSEGRNGDLKVSSFLQNFSSCGGESNIGKLPNAVSGRILDSMTAIYDADASSSSIEELHNTNRTPKPDLLKGCGALNLKSFTRTDVTIKLECDIVDQYSNDIFPDQIDPSTILVPSNQKPDSHQGAEKDANFLVSQLEPTEIPADSKIKTEIEPWSDERIMPQLIPSSSETVIYIDDDDDYAYECDNLPREKSQEVIDVASSPEMPTLIPFTFDDVNIKVERFSDYDETSLSKDAADSHDRKGKSQPHVLVRKMSLEDCTSMCSFKDKDDINSESAVKCDSPIKSSLNKVHKKYIEKPIMDKIDGLQFFSFKSKKSMEKYLKIRGKKLFAKLQIGKMKADDREMIVPTKTTDITQIKGWENKYFAPESQFRSLMFEYQSPIDRNNGFKTYKPLAGRLKFSDKKFMDVSSNMSYSDDEQLYSSELLEVDRRFETGESSKRPSSSKLPGSNAETSGNDELLEKDDQPMENDQPVENESTDKNESTEKNNPPKDNDASEKKDSSETNGSPPKDDPSKSGDHPQKSNGDDLPKKEDSSPKKFPKKEKASRDSTPEREAVPKKEDSPKEPPHSAFISEALDKFLEDASQLNVSFLQKINPNITPVPRDASILSIGNLRKKDPSLRFQLLKRKRSLACEDKKDDLESVDNQMDVDDIPYFSSSTEEDIPVAQLKAIKRKSIEMPKVENTPKRIKKTSTRTPSEDSNSQRLVLRLKKEADDYKVADLSSEKYEGDDESCSSSESESGVIESYKTDNKGLVPIIKRTIFAKKEEPRILDEFIHNLNMLGTRKNVTMLLQTNQSYFNQAPAIIHTVAVKALGALISNEMFKERKMKCNLRKKVKSWEKYLPKKTDDTQKMKLAIKNFKRKGSDVTDGEGSSTSSRPQSKRAVKLPAHLETNEGYFDWILSQSAKKRSPLKSSQQKMASQKSIVSHTKESPPLSCDTIVSQSIEVTCASKSPKPLTSASKSPESLTGCFKSPKSTLRTPRKRRYFCSKCIPCARAAIYKKGSKQLVCVCRKKKSGASLPEKNPENDEIKIVQLSIVEQESPKKLHSIKSDTVTEMDTKTEIPVDYSKSSISKTSEPVNVTKLNLSVKISETDTLSSLLNKLSNMRSDTQELDISSKSSDTNTSNLKNSVPTTTSNEKICETDKLSSASLSNSKDPMPEANINSKPSELIDSATNKTNTPPQSKISDAPNLSPVLPCNGKSDSPQVNKTDAPNLSPVLLSNSKSDSAQVNKMVVPNLSPVLASDGKNDSAQVNKTDAPNKTTSVSVPSLPANKYFVILPVQKPPTKPGSNVHILPKSVPTTTTTGLSNQVVSSGTTDTTDKLKIIQFSNPNVSQFKPAQAPSYALSKVISQPMIRNIIPNPNPSTMRVKLLNIGKTNTGPTEGGSFIRPVQKQTIDNRVISHNGVIPVPGGQKFQAFNFKLGERFVLYPPVIANNETTARAGIIWPQSSKAVSESLSKISATVVTQAASLSTTSVVTQSASLPFAFVSSSPKSCSFSTTATQTLSCSETSAVTEPASCNVTSDVQSSACSITSDLQQSSCDSASDLQKSPCSVTSVKEQLINASVQSTVDPSKTIISQQPVVSSSVSSEISHSESDQTQTTVNRPIHQPTPVDYHNYSKKEKPTKEAVEAVRKKKKEIAKSKLKDSDEALIDVETFDDDCDILLNLKESRSSSASSASSSSSSNSSDSWDSIYFDNSSVKMKKPIMIDKSHKSEKERYRRKHLTHCFQYLRSSSKHFQNATSLVDTLRMANQIVDLEKKREEMYKLAKKGLQLRNMALLKKSMLIAESFTNPVERDLAKLQTIHTLAMSWAKHHPNEGNLLSALVSKGREGMLQHTAAKNSENIAIAQKKPPKSDTLDSQDSHSNEGETPPQIEIFNYYSVNRKPTESKCPNVVMQCKEKPGQSSELKNLLSNVSQNSNSSDVMSSNSSDKTSFMQRLRDNLAGKNTPKRVMQKNEEIKSKGVTTPIANAAEDDDNLNEDPLIIDLSNDSVADDKAEEVQDNMCTDVEKVPEKITHEASKDIVPKRQFPGLIPLFPQTPLDFSSSLGCSGNSGSHSPRLQSTSEIETIHKESITTSRIPAGPLGEPSYQQTIVRTVTYRNTSVTDAKVYCPDVGRKFPDLKCNESLEECERLGAAQSAYPGLAPLDSLNPEKISSIKRSLSVIEDKPNLSNSNKGQMPTSFTDVLKSNSEPGDSTSESKPLSLCMQEGAKNQSASESVRPPSVGNETVGNRSRSIPEEITIDDGDDDSQEMPSLSPNHDGQTRENSAIVPAFTKNSNADVNLSSSPDVPLNLSIGRNASESEAHISSSNQKELEGRPSSRSIPEEITIDDSDEEGQYYSPEPAKSSTVGSSADTSYETIEDSDDDQHQVSTQPSTLCPEKTTKTSKTLDGNKVEEKLVKSSEATVDCETIEDSSDDEEHCSLTTVGATTTCETIEDSDDEDLSETAIKHQGNSKKSSGAVIMCPAAVISMMCETIDDSDDEVCDSAKPPVLSTEEQRDSTKSVSATNKQRGSKKSLEATILCSTARTSRTCATLEDSEQVQDSGKPTNDSTVSSSAEITKTCVTLEDSGDSEKLCDSEKPVENSTANSSNETTKTVTNQDSDSNDIIEIQCSRSTDSSAVS